MVWRLRSGEGGVSSVFERLWPRRLIGGCAMAMQLVSEERLREIADPFGGVEAYK